MRVLLLVAGFLVAASPSSSQTTGIVDGRSKLFYESVGQGLETIVVLHGGPGLAHDYMRPEWDRLALSGRVIYYDQNGCGQSGRVPPYGWRSHVEDLDRLLRALTPDKRVVLAGSSWGSLLALAYTYYYPDRVKALILSGVPFGSTRSGSESSPPWAPPWVAPSRSRLDSVNRGLTVGPSRPRPPLEPRLQQRITEDCSDVGAIISTSLLDAPWLTQLETIAAPALIVHGSKPDQSPGDGGPWLAGKLPNATLVTIQDAGHDPWLDEPNAFFRAANAFVAKLPKSATR